MLWVRRFDSQKRRSRLHLDAEDSRARETARPKRRYFLVAVERMGYERAWRFLGDGCVE
jgi:hypothetical protein